jgi:hypothetical protein
MDGYKLFTREFFEIEEARAFKIENFNENFTSARNLVKNTKHLLQLLDKSVKKACKSSDGPPQLEAFEPLLKFWLNHKTQFKPMLEWDPK